MHPPPPLTHSHRASPPTSTGSEAIGGTWRSTLGARGPCPTPAHRPCPPGVIRTRPSAALDGLRVAAAATAMPAAVALRRAAHRRRRRAAGELPLPLPPLPRCHSASHRGAATNDTELPPRCQAGHCHRTAVVLPIALLPLMTPCCRCAAKLAAAAALLPPPRYRRHPAATLPAIAALLPRCRCRLCFYRCRRRRRRRRLRASAAAAANALPRRCRVGRLFRQLVSWLIGRLVGPNVSRTSSGLTF